MLDWSAEVGGDSFESEGIHLIMAKGAAVPHTFNEIDSLQCWDLWEFEGLSDVSFSPPSVPRNIFVLWQQS